MLIGSLLASAEWQSLTIRKNNGLTMKEATLLTGGGSRLACIAGLWKFPGDPERDPWMGRPPFSVRQLPLSPPEKEK